MKQNTSSRRDLSELLFGSAEWELEQRNARITWNGKKSLRCSALVARILDYDGSGCLDASEFVGGLLKASNELAPEQNVFASLASAFIFATVLHRFGFSNVLSVSVVECVERR